jgi:hypothetical protein
MPVILWLQWYISDVWYSILQARYSERVYLYCLFFLPSHSCFWWLWPGDWLMKACLLCISDEHWLFILYEYIWCTVIIWYSAWYCSVTYSTLMEYYCLLIRNGSDVLVTLYLLFLLYIYSVVTFIRYRLTLLEVLFFQWRLYSVLFQALFWYTTGCCVILEG